MTANDIHDCLGAKGWANVLAQFTTPEILRDRHGPCPACGGKDRFRFDNRRGHGDFFCNRCGSGDGFALIMRCTGLSFAEAKSHVMRLAGLEGGGSASGHLQMPAQPSDSRPRRDTLSAYGADLWASTSSLDGVAAKYLLARGLVIPPEESDLRWHPALKHPEGFMGPALVALVRDAQTGSAVTLHRTWINPDGSKRGDPPRLLLKGHKKAGGVVMLWPSETVTHGLAVAEGVESALAAAHVFTPIWACVDAGNLGALSVLAGVESLTVFADHDDAGLKAANACARRWADAGREAYIIAPIEHGRDCADLVAA